MRWILGVVGVLVAVVAVVVALGYALPVKHVASRQARLPQSPDKVFAVVTNVQDFPAWRPSVKRVEVLPPNEGRTRFREIGSDGSILYETDSLVPGKRLVNRIADPSLPFGGRWTYDLAPDGNGTLLTITENGEVYNPVFRFASRFIMGHTRTIDQFLTDLQKQLGTARD
jgi:uncharacterized protein YndB with AHSA1/START domain